MQNAIEIKNLNKTYKGSKKFPEKVALKDINLDIPKGSIFGLLGPNGAGKSTIINIMAGLVIKTSGTVNICGFDIDKNERNAKSHIGVVPQEINFDAFFTPKTSLEFQAGLYGVPKSERRTQEILDLVGLGDKGNASVRTLSGGMKRRLLIAKAMVHSPPILVLDEPTAGVDIELRRQLWENVKKLNRQGVTIVLTTHYLEEAEELCDRIAIINHGEIVACEEKETLLKRIDCKEIQFVLDRQITEVPESFSDYICKIKGKNILSVCYSANEQMAGEIIERVQKEGFGIADITTEQSDLEDVFMQLTAAQSAA
ncbi:MAG: ATP-binding cassette domain-containing protein [Alphaproteobacteria bacterium]|nr:ATP-binding cassette domain-containing protein [Alphaproteobacteria bacterium]